MEQRRKDLITDKDVELFKRVLEDMGIPLKEGSGVLQLMEYPPLNG